MLILAIIGTRSQPSHQTNTMTYAQFISGDRPLPASRPINIQSVAECSGIARETVRRKVAKLADMGLIKREQSGNLMITAQATNTLTSSTEASLQYLVEMQKHYQEKE